MHWRNSRRILLLAIGVLLLIGIVGYIVLATDDQSILTTGEESYDTHAGIKWEFDTRGNGTWKASSTPPDCEEPLQFPSPVDVDLVSGILYPGQFRGNEYKTHGGFRFDNRTTNDIEVRAIMDGYVAKASQYRNDGEAQFLIFFVNDCGILMKLDHLLTLSPKLQEVLKGLPLGENGDSRTTNIEPKVYFKKGEILATKIGYENFPGGYMGRNIFVDFGLYDLRAKNNFEYSADFSAQHQGVTEYGTHALCWFDYLNDKEEQIVRSLPAGGLEGKVSDYCR